MLGGLQVVETLQGRIDIREVTTSPLSVSDKRITLGSWTLTVSQTKQLANNMKTLSSSKVLVFLTAVGLKAPFASMAAALTINASVRNDVIYAGSHGKRVRITITDSATLHTSYSTQVTYKVV